MRKIRVNPLQKYLPDRLSELKSEHQRFVIDDLRFTLYD
jgi:hypothetical protein